VSNLTLTLNRLIAQRCQMIALRWRANGSTDRARETRHLYMQSLCGRRPPCHDAVLHGWPCCFAVPHPSRRLLVAMYGVLSMYVIICQSIIDGRSSCRVHSVLSRWPHVLLSDLGIVYWSPERDCSAASLRG